MMPMGLAFGALSMLIGGVDGFYRSLLQFQRDDLAVQLDLNERHRKQLEEQYAALRRLELSKQRTMRFLVHDLKNHVGCVLGYVNQLLRRTKDLGWRRADTQTLETIQRRASRMAGALNDLLELARLEDQPRLRFESIPAAYLLRRAVEEIALGPGEGPVLVDAHVPEDLEIECDVALLERVVANLVLNAYKHNGPDVQVVVGASRLDPAVRFFCRDSGGGISDAIRDRLFEEFASGDRPRDRVSSFGLGLSFCKAAIEAHGGRIWFESAEGGGTTVFFSLPIQGQQGDTT
jgi:signal transduction histidine kinase